MLDKNGIEIKTGDIEKPEQEGSHEEAAGD